MMPMEFRPAPEDVPSGRRIDDVQALGDLPLDYYLIFSEGDRECTGPPVALLVEEFVLREDHTAAGIDNAVWSAVDGTWSSQAELSRTVRADAGLRERVFPVSRRTAEASYAAASHATTGGGRLPGEAALRSRFRDRQPLPAAEPLFLTSDPATAEPRRHRILFAKDLDQSAYARLRSVWGLRPADDPNGRVVGTVESTVGGRVVRSELRRVGPGIAWAVDVVAPSEGVPATDFAALLHQHRRTLREHGLIPVTIERLA